MSRATADVVIELTDVTKTYRTGEVLVEALRSVSLVVREGAKVSLACRANATLTDIVKRVERNELSPDPRHITELRLN